MKRGLVAALVAPILALCAMAPPASAYWSAAGAGAGQASADTLPTGSQPSVASSGQTVTVTWAQSTFHASPLGSYGGGGYSVRRYPAAGGAAVTPGAGCAATIGGSAANLSCQESSAPPGSWRYTITPVLGSWTGAESPTSSAVDVAPGAPTLTAATAKNPAAGQTTGDIRVDWAAVPGATGYNVYRRKVSGAFDFTAPLNGPVAVTATSYTDSGSGLVGGTAYAYVVRAVTGSIQGASSNELTATAVAPPAAPTNVTAVPGAGGKITAGWTAVSGAIGYNVYRRTTGGAYDYAAPVNGATLVSGASYADTTAVNGTSYRYVVRAVGAGAGAVQLESVDSVESAIATADAVAPSSVSITDPGSPLHGTVNLGGSATDTGSGITGMRFQYAPAGTSGWTDGCTATTSPYSCALNTSALADGLYDLRVIATDAAGNSTTSSVVTNRRVDNTAPSVTIGDPGAFVRATVTLTATAADTGSGLASLRIQRAATGTGTWTDVCTVTTSPASCALNTGTLADGGIDLRAIATDQAGNAATSALVSNRVIDNTAPTGVDVQTTNVSGGTAGKPEAGDTLTFTFSEPMRPASILSGWAGASANVVVRFLNGNPDVITVWDATNSTQTALGSVTSGKKYVTSNITFTGSTMVLSGNTVTVTLGTPSGATASANGSSALQWTLNAAATDRAGNALTAGTIAESGVLDLDF